MAAVFEGFFPFLIRQRSVDVKRYGGFDNGHSHVRLDLFQRRSADINLLHRVQRVYHLADTVVVLSIRDDRIVNCFQYPRQIPAFVEHCGENVIIVVVVVVADQRFSRYHVFDAFEARRLFCQSPASIVPEVRNFIPVDVHEYDKCVVFKDLDVIKE